MQASRREALFTAAVWVGACVYTCTFAYFFAYRQAPQPELILGMPSWVFWGILAPWAACLALTIWAALRGLRDEELGEEDTGA